jgi:hypothetical protein
MIASKNGHAPIVELLKTRAQKSKASMSFAVLIGSVPGFSLRIPIVRTLPEYT